MKENWRTNRSDPVRLTRPYFASVLEYLRPWIGRESWDHFDIRDLPVTTAILHREIAYVKASLRKRFLIRRALSQHRRLCRATDSIRSVKKLLFLCSGNICRSPFAAQLAKTELAQYQIDSSGFHNTVGRHPPDDIVNVARSMGVDVSQCQSSRLTAQQIAHVDLILVVDLSNYERLANEFPQALAKTLLLGLFKPRPSVSIRDPYQSPESEIRSVLNEIAAGVNGLLTWLKSINGNEKSSR